MLFNSFEFLIFFPLVTTLFFLLPHRFRWLLLLISSCIFYCYFIPAYLLILVFIILVDYIAGIYIEKSKIYKKLFLLASILSNLLILGIFKYYNFFVLNFNESFGTAAPTLQLLLPIGLSFHTFQAMAYTIEVYKGTIRAEKHLGIYALYVLFYPQLVAGPIERPQNLLPQFKRQQYFKIENIIDGARLMTWGFFKKLVIADNIGKYVDMIQKDPTSYHWGNVMLSVFYFSIQIYCDFSGYTDIARGAAKSMGFNLMLNFNRPFQSSSLREFWHRWHISLSTWFRDYVYIRLGGNQKGISTKIIALLIVFLLSGLWHGAGWNFLCWGIIHAFFLILFLLLSRNTHTKQKTLLYKIYNVLLVNFIVAYAFVFFRNAQFSSSLEIIKSSFNFNGPNSFQVAVNSKIGLPGIGTYNMLIWLTCIVGMLIFEWKTDPELKIMNKYFWLDIIWFISVITIIVYFGVFSKENFIYFQF